jgi:hypothetical protein
MKRYPTGTNAFAKSVVADTGLGRLLNVSCYNANAGDMYLQIFDAASLPADGTVPLAQVRIPTTGTGSLDFGESGLPYSDGLVAALSSTAASLTLAAATDGLFCAVTDHE